MSQHFKIIIYYIISFLYFHYNINLRLGKKYKDNLDFRINYLSSINARYPTIITFITTYVFFHFKTFHKLKL